MPRIEWSILTIGHLSMNKFWGESERKRGPLCTSTLLLTGQGLLLVDPSVHPPQMPDLLNDQAGVNVDDVSMVFLTHFHGDHRFGLEAFPRARWLMAPAEIAWQREHATEADRALLDRIEPADGEIVPGVSTLATPGHTLGHTSLRFMWRGLRVVIAADAAMTEDFFRAREGYHNSADMDQVRTTIDLLTREADIIIPGHGNYFMPPLAPSQEGWT